MKTVNLRQIGIRALVIATILTLIAGVGLQFSSSVEAATKAKKSLVKNITVLNDSYKLKPKFKPEKYDYKVNLPNYFVESDKYNWGLMYIPVKLTATDKKAKIQYKSTSRSQSGSKNWKTIKSGKPLKVWVYEGQTEIVQYRIKKGNKYSKPYKLSLNRKLSSVSKEIQRLLNEYDVYNMDTPHQIQWCFLWTCTMRYDRDGCSDPRGAFWARYGNCEDFSYVFSLFMDELKIPNNWISNSGKDFYSNHAWNLVQIDDVWYHIDTVQTKHFLESDATHNLGGEVWNKIDYDERYGKVECPQDYPERNTLKEETPAPFDNPISF